MGAAQVAHSLTEYQDQIRVQAERLLSAAATQAREAGVPCETLRATDEDPYRAIINAAAERGCDLIAMASHGRRGMAAVVLGSQTQKAVSYTHLVCTCSRCSSISAQARAVSPARAASMKAWCSRDEQLASCEL